MKEVMVKPTYVETLLRDADEIDTAITNGKAKIYMTPDELFVSWENSSGAGERKFKVAYSS